jgi:MFS family permease
MVWAQGPFVIRELGGTALQCLLLSIAQGVPLVAAVFVAPLVGRRNPIRLTSLFLATGGAIVLAAGLCKGTWSLSIVLALALMATTPYRISLGVALQQVYPDQWRGKLLSMPSTVDMLARGLCLVGTGILLGQDIESYRVLFPAAGLCMVLGAFLFRHIPGSRGDGAQAAVLATSSPLAHARDAVAWMMTNKGLLVFLLGYFLVTSGGVLFANALPLFANDDLRMTPDQWSYATAARMLATLASFWFWGHHLDRFGAPSTMMVCWATMGVEMGLMFFVHGWVWFLVLTCAQGLVMAGNILAFFPIVMHFTSASDTARGMGLHASLWGVRWVIVPASVVMVVDWHIFPTRYLFLGCFGLVAIGLVAMARASSSQPVQEQPSD